MDEILSKEIENELTEEVEKTMKFIYPNHTIERPGKLLISQKGCDKQPYHYDFSPDEEYESNDKGPLVCFETIK